MTLPWTEGLLYCKSMSLSQMENFVIRVLNYSVKCVNNKSGIFIDCPPLLFVTDPYLYYF